MREIYYAFKDWIIHLFDTHCTECRHDNLEDIICNECEYLKSLLETERHEKEKLLEFILHKPVEQSVINDDEELTPIKTTKYEPWHVRRSRLEAEDRKKLNDVILERRMAEDSKKSTSQLEKEILGEENANANNGNA